VKESTCDYVMLIDSDAYVPKQSPCWLTTMMQSIENTGLVIPVSSSQGGAHQYVTQAEKYPSYEYNKDIWSGYCFLFTKEAYKKVGPFQEKFYIYGQDSEWAHRAKRIGGAVMRKDVLVEHIGGYSFSSDPLREEDKTYARALFQYLTK
jgi:GT2 family glycosyltransferase